MIQELSFILGLDLLKKTRQTEYVWSRYACFYLLSVHNHSNSEISRMFGIGHCTVLYGIDQFRIKLFYGDETAVRLWNKVNGYFIEFDKGSGI